VFSVVCVVALVGAGVTAGVLLCVAISLVPGFIALPPDDYIAAHKLFGRYFDRIMPPIVVVTTLLVAALAALAASADAERIFIAGALCMLSISVISQSRNVPINRKVKRLETAPDDWQDPRSAWRNWHVLRTSMALIGMTLISVGIVVSLRGGRQAPMRFNILGPLEVSCCHHSHVPTAPMLQQFLALLVSSAGHVVPTETISKELWPHKPAQGTVNAIQTFICELRKLLSCGENGPVAAEIQTDPAGYRLVTQVEQVDAFRFGKLLGMSWRLLRSPAPAEFRRVPGPPRQNTIRPAAEALGQALDLWRGDPFAGIPTGSVLELQAASLSSQLVRASQLSIYAALALSRYRESVGELRKLVAQHPFEEIFRAQLMVALCGSQRRGEAVLAYRDHLDRLQGELGTVPCPPMRAASGRAERKAADSGTNSHPAVDVLRAGGSCRCQCNLHRLRSGKNYRFPVTSGSADVSLRKSCEGALVATCS
jgi:DNA-binding SARP family transcriptional activator/uncharacterized membrane protein